jgi:hypothetical protein
VYHAHSGFFLSMMMSAVIGDADIEVRAAVIGGWRVVVARVTNEQQPHAAAGLYGDDRVTRTDPTRLHRRMEPGRPSATATPLLTGGWKPRRGNQLDVPIFGLCLPPLGNRCRKASGGGGAPAVPRWGTAASSSRLATTCIASVVCEQQVQLMPISLVELYIQRPMMEQVGSTVIRGAIKSN